MPDRCYSLNLMGGRVEIVLYNTEKHTADLIKEEIYDEALALESIFNFFDPKSELSLLNLSRKKVVSSHLLKVIKSALIFCELSNGAYDISLGKLFKARKSGKDLPKLNCSYEDIEIKKNIICLNNKEVMIDLGSIAKGYIADCLVESMKNKGVCSGLIDARGDIRIFGKISEKISIQDPRIKGKTVTSFELKNKAVATSGDYSQFYGSFDKSHIITNENICSATVIYQDLMTADALSSVLFVSPPEVRKKVMSRFSKSRAFLINKHKKEEKYRWFKNTSYLLK